MSFIPKYQWLTEYGVPKCGGCDKIYITDTINKEFQTHFTPTVLVDEDFNGNDITYPMEQICVGDGSIGSCSGVGIVNGMTFDLDITFDKHWFNSFSFFYEGQPYCYVFANDEEQLEQYIVTDYGNFHLVKMTAAFAYINYLIAFNNVMNQYGIYAIGNGTPSITVYGFPDNTQVAYDSITVTEGLGTATWGIDNFLPINNEICFFQTSSLLIPPLGATATPSIFKEAVVPANKRMIFTVEFTNSFTSEITLNLQIRDNTFTLIDTVSAIALPGNNTLILNYTTGATPPTSYYFDFRLDAIAGEIQESMVGFCYENIRIEYINALQNIEAIDCNGNNFTVDYTSEYNNSYNDLITIQDILPDVFYLVITDDEANEWRSLTYQQLTALDCTKRNFMRFKWWSDCAFADIDYKNLPFVNDVYIQGYSMSLPLDTKESIVNVLSTGEVDSVYNYSLEKREFNIGLYTEFFYRTLQRAFKHKFIEIDSVAYKQDSDSNLIKKPENDSKFTAKIELIESGSEVIVTSCCN